MHGLWSRIRKGRLFQVLAVYLGASWLILEVAGTLRENLGLPAWIFGAAFILLATGLLVVLATGWVQSHPLVDARAEAEEVPSAWEFDLSDLWTSLQSGRLPHLTWARALAGGAIVLLLFFGFSGLYVLLRDRGIDLTTSPAEAAALPGVAVLPFEVRGEGLEALREGIGTLFNANMDGFEGVRPIDSRTVLARWRERVATAEADLATALDVARAAHATYAVIGEVVRLGERVHLTATVHDVGTGTELGSARADGPMDSLASTVDALSVDVLRTVLAPGTSNASRPRYLAAATTSSTRALWAFLQGESRFARADGPGAIAAYQRAVEIDSTFALAHFRLSRAYSWLEVEDSAGPHHSRLALRYADRLPPREAALARAVVARRRLGGGEWSLAELERLARTYPDDPEIWMELGDAYYHLSSSMLLPLDKAAVALDRAIAIDSAFWPAYAHRVTIGMAGPEAEQIVSAFEEHAPSPAFAAGARVMFSLVHGDSAARVQALAVLDTAGPDVLMSAAWFLPQSVRAITARNALLTATANTPPHRRPPGMRSPLLIGLFENFQQVAEGRISAHMASQRRLTSSAPGPVRSFLALNQITTHLLGLPVPEDALASVLEADTGLAGALYAASRQRWDQYERVLARLERTAAEVQDDDSARVLRGRAEVAEGFAAWRRGRPEEAIAILERARQNTVSADYLDVRVDLANHHSRWLLAKLHAELGRHRDALRYFETINDPFSRFEQAELHARLGNTEEARRAYLECLEAWRNADPDFGYAVRAREGLQRLSRDLPSR